MPRQTTPSPDQQLLLRYEVREVLGEGSFGVVYACADRSSGDSYAVKMVDKVETSMEDIVSEVQVLQALQHPNVIRFREVFFAKCFVCIVTDRYLVCVVDALQAHIKKRGKLCCRTIVHIHQQMSSSIAYLHSRDIIHRDIKVDNYMMDRMSFEDTSCHIALIDFGLATQVTPGERLTERQGTDVCWSPEVLSGSYSLKADIWALGVTIFALSTGKFPFKDEHETLYKELKITHKSMACEDFQDFLGSMLKRDEGSRLSSEAMMAHPWLNAERTSSPNMAAELPDRLTARRSSHCLEIGGEEIEIGFEEVDWNIRERRAELVERMTRELSRSQNQSVRMREFTIPDLINRNGASKTFTWWSQDKVEKSSVLRIPGTEKNAGADAQLGLCTSPEVIGKLLKDFDIDITKLGVGPALSLEQLANEVHHGTSRFMIDASRHKRLVRVQDVVQIRLEREDTETTTMLLIERKGDATGTGGHWTNGLRLPSLDMLGHENNQDVAKQVLTEVMNLNPDAVALALDTVELVEEEAHNLPEYPGIKTTYRKWIVPARFTAAPSAPLVMNMHLANNGGQEEQYLTFTESRSLAPSNVFKTMHTFKSRRFVWMSVAEVQALKVKVEACENDETSSFVMAPIGLDREDKNIDTSMFLRSPKELALQLARGECRFMTDADGETVRVVDIVVLKLTDCKAEDQSPELLVQTGQTYPGGNATQVEQLPGERMRPEENVWLAAKRLVRQQLGLDESQVKFAADGVVYIEECRTSMAFPGIRTMYRKRLVSAELQDDGQMPPAGSADAPAPPPKPALRHRAGFGVIVLLALLGLSAFCSSRARWERLRRAPAASQCYLYGARARALREGRYHQPPSDRLSCP